MRLLLIALLAANLLVFAWNRGWLNAWIGDARQPQGIGAQWNPDRLRPVPLSRLDDADETSAAASAAARSGAAAETHRAPHGNGNGSTAGATNAASEPNAANEPNEPNPPNENAPNASPRAAASAAAAGVAARGSPTSPATSAGANAAAPATSASGSPRDAAATCLAFVAIDESRATGLRAALEAAGARVEEQRREQGASYLVYLPPAATLADAQRRLAELHRIGRNDAFLIPDGPYRLGISLGVFRAESAARAMVSKLAQAGEPGALVAARAPIQVRVRLEARWPDAGSAKAAETLAQRFDATQGACD